MGEESSKGFIKLSREICDWQWFNDLPTAKIFIYLLLHANYTHKKWKNIDILRGQLITSIQGCSIENELNWRTVKRAFENLISTGEIITETFRIGKKDVMLVTIVNYNKYQGDGTPFKAPTKNESTQNKIPEGHKDF